MMSKETANKLIEERFRSLPWYGVSSLSEAIEHAQEYRHSLCLEELRWFDEALEHGAHPSYAIELVEGLSGRQAQQTGRQTADFDVAIAKAS
jgi:hypothetical protein